MLLLCSLAAGLGWVVLNGRATDSDLFRCDDCNLLLISIDTLRADRLGSAGYERATSPNLDRFAAQGFAFTDVLAQAPTTAPSHRSMFSGRYVFQHRNKLHDTPVLASILKQRGYRTAGFVDGAQLSTGFGLNRGFELWHSSGGKHVAGAQLGGGLQALNPPLILWLEQHRDQQFFVFLHTYDVHCPYTPPEPFRSMFTGGMEAGLDVEGRCGGVWFKRQQMSAAYYDYIDYISALYDGGVRYVDHKLQEVFNALTRLELDRRTIVVVTSDHGESLGERGQIGHNNVYDKQLKVPLIIRLPATGGTGDGSMAEWGAGRAVDTPAQLVDLLPTLLGLLGAGDSVPAGLPGRDLSRFLAAQEGDADAGRLRLAENGARTRATIRLGPSHSLILRAGVPQELYDLQRDPDEEANLLPGAAELVAPLLAAYQGLGGLSKELPELPSGLDERTLKQLKALGYLE